jgi:hypothetical protein
MQRNTSTEMVRRLRTLSTEQAFNMEARLEGKRGNKMFCCVLLCNFRTFIASSWNLSARQNSQGRLDATFIEVSVTARKAFELVTLII